MKKIFALAVFLVSALSSEAVTTLVSDDFTTTGNWSASGNAGVSSGEAFVNRNGSIGSNILSLSSPLSLDTDGYTSVTIAFDWRTDAAFFGPDQIVLQYTNDGSTWQTLSGFTNNAGSSYSQTLEEGTYTFTDSFSFRFVNNVNGDNKNMYIDNMLITAPDPIPEPSAAVLGGIGALLLLGRRRRRPRRHD